MEEKHFPSIFNNNLFLKKQNKKNQEYSMFLFGFK